MMTAKELAEIRARCEAATPGPWIAQAPDDSCQDWFVRRAVGVEDVPPEKFYVMRMGRRDGADAVFTAHSRTDLPRLLAHIKAQDERLKRLDAVAEAAKAMRKAFGELRSDCFSPCDEIQGRVIHAWLALAKALDTLEEVNKHA